jgi:hypothetical protein
MKLKAIENNITRKGMVKITFSKNGSLSISLSAMEKYGFKQNDKVIILQDEESPDDFYIVKSESPGSVMLRATSGKSLMVGYSKAVEKIRKHFNIPEDDTFSVGLGGQIKTDFGSAIVLITAGLKKYSQ